MVEKSLESRYPGATRIAWGNVKNVLYQEYLYYYLHDPLASLWFLIMQLSKCGPDRWEERPCSRCKRLKITCIYPSYFKDDDSASELRDLKRQIATFDPSSRKLPDEVGQRLLRWAAGNQRHRLIEKLLDAGTNIEAEARYSDDTPLFWAAYAGDLRIVDLLISRGAKVSATILGDIFIQDIVRHVCGQYFGFLRGSTSRRRYFEVIQLLLEAGADVNATDRSHGKFLLLHAAIRNPRFVALLLAAGGNCNIVDSYGMTSLHRAAMYGEQDVVEKLLAAGADVNVTMRTRSWDRSGGGTPVHLAVAHRRVDIAARLLAVPELDMSITDVEGRTVGQAVFDLYVVVPQAFRDEGIDIENSQVIFLNQRRPPIPLVLSPST